MSQNIKNELIEVLRSMREHARVLGELGIENVALDSSEAAACEPLRTSAQAVAPAPSLPSRALDLSRTADEDAQPAVSLFRDVAPAVNSLPPSNESLEQIGRAAGRGR